MTDENKSLILNVNDVLNTSESSVKLTQTSKGVNWEIKIYNSNPETAFTIAEELFNRCKEKYGGNTV